LRKRWSSRFRRLFSIPNRQDQKESLHVIIFSTYKKERILKAAREKCQVTYKKDKPIRITAGFSVETLKPRRAWNGVFQALKENNCQPR
jgi:hypothetical protein